MKKSILFTCLLGIFVLQACNKKEKDQPTTVGQMNDINVPDGFFWESSRDVAFSVSVQDSRFGSATHVISIYDGDPFNGGNLLSKGSATNTEPFENNLSVSKNIQELYVMKTAPDNSRMISKMGVTGRTNVSFTDDEANVGGKPGRSGAKTTTINCTGGTVINSNSQNVNVTNGGLVRITGNNITVSFNNVTNGTIMVCGTNVKLNSLNMKNSTTLLVASSGSVSSSSNQINLDDAASVTNEGTMNVPISMNSTGTVQNDGTMTVSNMGMAKGTFINNGTFSFNGYLSVNSNMVFTNNGTINVQTLDNSATAVLTNNGTIDASNEYKQQSNGSTINNCKIITGGDFYVNGPVSNYKLITVGGLTRISGSKAIDMYSLSMLKTNGLNLDGNIVGQGSNTAFVKFTGTTFWGSGKFISNLQVCSDQVSITSKLQNGATAGCTLYIPTDGCNTLGNGTPTVTDTDNDGGPDATDDYPNDPTKAYNNNWPTTGMATAAFEDNWPAKGDYDFNDLVMSYKYNIVTSATNKVVQVNGTYKLQATGGTFSNGFGIEFPVAKSKVTGLSFGTLETGQTNAVVLLFSNMRNEMSNWNTEPGASKSNEVDYTMQFNVTNGPTLINFGLSGYNPFIWNNGESRGKETHIAGRAPTDLATSSYFGQDEDNTSISAGRYYVTTNGYPYAIEVPSSFEYPIERADITQAYLKFGSWAQSGGTSYTNWFSSLASGYRNTSKIYNE